MAPAISHQGWIPSSTVNQYSWVPSPDTRGTLDIVWPCLTTMALCLWSMLHLNLPAKDETYRTEFLRRLRWLFLGVLCPELPILFAFAQLSSARQSVEDMKKLPNRPPHWTITHGFYADSGGFILDVVGSPPFPVTAKQMLYLLSHNYIDTPTITQLDIQDKSKADGLAKALTFFQSGWLMLRFLGRAAQGLSITPFELFTAAVVLCSLVSLCLWWHKPLNVREPTVVRSKCNMATILAAASEAKMPYVDTPLDFIEPDIYWSRKWCPAALNFVLKHELQTRPINRIPNDRDFKPRNFEENYYLGCPVCIFSAIHFLGWSIEFPSSAELIIWRANSIAIFGSLSIYGASEMIGFWQADYSVSSLEVLGSYKKHMPWCLVFLTLGTLYFLSRLILLIEAVISLRDLPERAFLDVSWLQFVPQF
ncbi:hypothetical protein F4801DRAFT_541856 [Xylaria longipes]|nr:hypothetical protein F4801DRAFT_541856 [Xylaria longipes]RYC60574.1 hypothetical protein CHU98_g5629 [Xylaria longipes]